jgi:hypothetical protein
MRDWKYYLMCLGLAVGELVICGLVMYYLSIEDTTCDEVRYALGAFVIAQFGHIIIVALNLFAHCDHCHFVTLGIWLGILTVFVTFAILLITSETCETTQDFNIAFAIVLAELLTSFILSCCSFCTDHFSCCRLSRQAEKGVSPDQQDAPRNRPPIELTEVNPEFRTEEPSSASRLGVPINCELLISRTTTLDL